MGIREPFRQAAKAKPSTSLSAASPRRKLGPWSPSSTGTYKLPREVEGRLVAALSDFRNREAAFDLAVFIGRHWSLPARLIQAFPIDRRALADHEALGLSEARVRGAIATLEAVGFLDRDLAPKGSAYRATEAGLHRKPILWRLGTAYGPAFAQANRRSKVARGAPAPARRPITPTVPARPPTSRKISPAKVAQKQNPIGEGVLMGDHNVVVALNSGLEAALARLKRAIGEEQGASQSAKHGLESPQRPQDGRRGSGGGIA